MTPDVGIIPVHLFWNAVLLAFLGFLIRFWLSSLTKSIDKICKHQEETFERLRATETKVEVLDTRVTVLERSERGS